MTRDRVTSAALTVILHVLGVVSFVYPFFIRGLTARGEDVAHAGDAPVLFTVFSVLLIALAVTEVRAGRMDAKQIALLGILSGVNAVLRAPGSFGGANLMFFLPIVCGYAFGSRFGFLLGASSMAASAFVTAGLGPWLPFQMWALGWMGAGAGALRGPLRARTGVTAVLVLAAYGWLAGFAVGALLNLWFWPFLGGRADISWHPGLGAWQALVHYWRFYVLTSLAWDSFRAFIDAVLIVLLGRPVLRLLMKFRARLEVSWVSARASMTT